MQVRSLGTLGNTITLYSPHILRLLGPWGAPAEGKGLTKPRIFHTHAQAQNKSVQVLCLLQALLYSCGSCALGQKR